MKLRPRRFWAVRRGADGHRGRALLTVAGSSLGGQLILLAASPLLTRLYSPTDFGIYTAVLAVVAIGAVVSTGRLELAIPIQKSDREARQLVWASMWMLIPTGVAAAVVVAIAQPLVESSDLGAGLYPWLWAAPAAMGAYAVADVFTQYAIRRRRYTAVARRNFLQGALGAAGQLALAVPLPQLGLVVGQVGGRLLAGLSMVRGAGLGSRRSPGRPDPVEAIRVAWFHRRFMATLVPAALLNTIGTQVAPVLIGFLFGAPVLGFLGLVQRVLGAPTSLVGHAVYQLYLGEAASETRRSGHTDLRGFLRLSARLASTSLLVFGLLAAVSPAVFPLVFGSEWALAGSLAQIMCLAFALQFVAFPTSQTLILNDAASWQLAWDGFRLVLTLSSVAAAWLTGGDIVSAVWALSISSAVSYLVLWLAALLAITSRKSAAGSLGEIR